MFTVDYTLVLALIDGDLLVYRVGYTCDPREGKDLDPQWVAKARVTEMLDGILADTNATEYQVWLSDAKENNFRWQLWNGYKANRTKPKPIHYDFIKELLITEWGARIAYGMEADDALGINQKHPDGADSVIASIDKDLLQIAGLHYNFVKKEWQDVNEEEGLRSFYVSILVGDVTDNIRGCRGIGPVKAGKATVGCSSEESYLTAILDVYKQQEKDKSTEEILDHITLAGQLLKIRQSEGEEIWRSRWLDQMKETLSQSTPQKQVALTQSTARI